MSSSSDVATASDTWQPDHLLDNYQIRSFDLGPDPDDEGPITATLVRRAHRVEQPTGAVLYVHGFTDYFFQEPLAEFFADRQYEFFALDLRKCGRSWAVGQTPHYVSDLAFYDVELDLAFDRILDELAPDAPVLIAAHSTGGLIAALWLDRLRRTDPARHARISGAVLNSPWFDLQGRAILRSPLTAAVVKAVAAVRPLIPLPQEVSGAYGESLHESVHGEWAYDLQRKPLGGFPVTLGWISAIRSGQFTLHRGLDIGVPSLVLRSDKTHFGPTYGPQSDTADLVLDVEQIGKWAGCLGNRVTSIPIADARHDVFLSVPRVRAAAYREVDAWLRSL